VASSDPLPGWSDYLSIMAKAQRTLDLLIDPSDPRARQEVYRLMFAALATGYLLIFGAGTMLGMMCMTTAMAVPLAYAGNHFTKVSKYLRIASGMVSLCFGTFLVYQLGFLGGLFTAHPQWTPR